MVIPGAGEKLWHLHSTDLDGLDIVPWSAPIQGLLRTLNRRARECVRREFTLRDDAVLSWGPSGRAL